MRRKDKEITQHSIIGQILAEAEICRLGLVDNNEAYIVPVNYAFSDGKIYIHSARNGRKIDIIRKNSAVVFEIESHTSIVTGEAPCDWTARYRSVMGKGRITIEENAEIKKHALDLIMTKYGWNSSPLVYDEALLLRMCILVLQIEEITGKQSGNWEERSIE